MRHSSKIGLVACLSATLLIGCGRNESDSGASSGAGSEAAAGLTAEQLEHGIGPITPFELGEFDATLAATGAETFQIKCSACHKIDQRYIGPALGDVLERRSPAYVMNMILNPEEMLIKHPEAKAMLAEYMTPMANQNLTQDEARSILEYLRAAPADSVAS
jgi:mono/diheme cytochrome c family protein